jgi:hypothetical protein
MTETEWLECADPTPMLEFLRGKASERKLRLFACACCRRLWHLLTDERSRNAVEVAERFADGSGNKQALQIAKQEAEAAIESLLSLPFRPVMQAAAAGTVAVVNIEATEAARLACGWARNVSLALAYEEMPVDLSGTKEKVFVDWGVEAAALYRCIFGNPFRPLTLYSSWLTPAVKALAQATYDDLALERLPSLVDELAKAGCANEEILGHCRGPGPHVRGCWVVDLVLGKA